MLWGRSFKVMVNDRNSYHQGGASGEHETGACLCLHMENRDHVCFRNIPEKAMLEENDAFTLEMHFRKI